MHCIVSFHRRMEETRTPSVGMDAEWTYDNKSRRRRVALLQLATLDGFCLLIRLCRMRHIPEELKVCETCNKTKSGELNG